MSVRSRFLRPLSLPCAAVLVSLVPALPALAQSPARAVPVEVAKAELREMVPRLMLPGDVHSRDDASLAVEVGGRVVWLAEPGDTVAAGDPLVRLDDRELRLRLAELDAQLREVAANRRFQAAERDRVTRLAADGNAPASRLEEARSRTDALDHGIARLETQREIVLLDLERTVLRAPFSGRVAARSGAVGEMAMAGAPLLRLVDPDRLEVRVKVPAAAAAILAPGMSVTVEGTAGPLATTVRAVAPVADPASRLVEVRLDPAPTATAVLKPGIPVRVAVPVAAPSLQVAVPEDALVLRAGGIHLMRVAADGTAQRISLPTGPGRLSEAGWLAVGEALAVGDAVVVRGAERLADGQAVQVVATRSGETEVASQR